MHNTNCGIGLIDMLTSGSAGAHGFHFQIIHINIKILRFNFRCYQNGCCRGMDTPLTFCLGNALYTMTSGFKLQFPINAIPLDHKGDKGEAACFTVIHFYDFYLPALTLCKFAVHPVQVTCEDISFISTGCPANLHDGIMRIIGILWYQ